MRPLVLSMEEGCILCSFAVHAENRTGRDIDVYSLMAEGITRMDGVYLTDEGETALRSHVRWAERFGFGALNVRVIDSCPEVRRWYRRGYNVSRAYHGARRRGYYKLVRWLFRQPDVFINLKGRSLDNERERELIRSVIQHEFAHVMGLRDQYRRRSLKKRRKDIDDRDIMYMTGASQRFMGYQILRIKRFAMKGRLPLWYG